MQLLKRLLILVILLGGTRSLLVAQALPTAKRSGDAQVGIGFVLAKPDYSQKTFRGYMAYADFDFRSHFGVEAEFHQIAHSNSESVYERTYEIGGRYVRQYGIFAPYVKALVGRGVFNFPNNRANLAYNIGAFGGGTDIKVRPNIYVRVDGEYQDWFSFPPNGLSPILGTVGVAYHWK